MTEWKRETPWRQGHVLTGDAVSALKLQHPDHPEETLVIVASHDCDLTQLPAHEPHVEVIVGRRIKGLDGNCTNAKSPRTIHMAFEGNPSCLAEFAAIRKQFINKQDLVGFAPDPNFTLSPSARQTFQRWLAVRYRRSAFPDEFMSRMATSNLMESIKRAAKRHGGKIRGIFFDVDDGHELVKTGPANTYTLDIIVLHSDEPDFASAETEAQALAAAIKDAFESKLFDKKTQTWSLIELRHLDVVSEGSLTYYVYKNLKEWRLEYMSLAADPQEPMTDD